jgi:hypothetical protein
VNYVTAAVPIPEMVIVKDAAFLTAHGGAGNEQATFSTLYGIIAANKIIIPADNSVPGYSAQAKLFWDETAKIYYTYRIAGTSQTYSVPNALGVMVPWTNPTASYLALGVSTNSGSSFPTIWCKDYYSAKTWLPNTTLRITFGQGGDFTVNMSDWFTTIIQ